MAQHKVYLLGNLERCAYSYYYDKDPADNKYKLFYHNVETDRIVKTTQNVYFISPNYIYDDNTSTCYPDTALSELGMSQSSYNFLMGLTGSFVGFALLIGLIILSARK
jgi:hypothetical protein